MSQRKVTTKGSKKGKAEGRDLEARARAIIADVKHYGEDTRHAVSNMLRENSEDLAEYVRRVERGEEVFDLVSPLPIAETLPELIAAVLTHEDTPVRLLDAMHDVIGSLPGFDKALNSAPFIAELLRAGAEKGGE
jgi:hypothetical protein